MAIPHPTVMDGLGNVIENPEYAAYLANHPEGGGGNQQYEEAMVDAMDTVTVGSLRGFLGGSSDITAAIDGLAGQAAAAHATIFCQHIEAAVKEAEGQDIPIGDLVKEVGWQLHHKWTEDYKKAGTTFAEVNHPEEFAEARKVDEILFRDADDFESAERQLRSRITFEESHARAHPSGRTPLEHHDELERMIAIQATGTLHQTPDADPDADGPGQGLVLDEDGIFRDPVPMGNSSDDEIRATFDEAYVEAGGYSQRDLEASERDEGLNVRQMNRAEVNAARRMIEGPPGEKL